jgi:hypothetical protein
VASHVSPALWASVFLRGPPLPPSPAGGKPFNAPTVTVFWLALAVASLAMSLVAARELDGALYIVPATMVHVIA